MSSSDPTLQVDHVKYHYPNFLIDKHYHEWPTFNRNNPDHHEYLIELQKIEDGTERSWKAGDVYGNYWFSLKDLRYVRGKLRFKPLSEKLLSYLDDILCSCHKFSLAKSEGGIVFRHENHYFHLRVANHMSKEDGIFIKIQASSYFTADGNLSKRSSPDSHIKSIDEVLSNTLGWYQPPCQHIYSLKNFDYSRMEGARLQRRLEEQRKGIYVREESCAT